MCVPVQKFPNEFAEQLNLPKISQETPQNFPTIMRIIIPYSGSNVSQITQNETISIKIRVLRPTKVSEILAFSLI